MDFKTYLNMVVYREDFRILKAYKEYLVPKLPRTYRIFHDFVNSGNVQPGRLVLADKS